MLFALCDALWLLDARCLVCLSCLLSYCCVWKVVFGENESGNIVFHWFVACVLFALVCLLFHLRSLSG